MRVSLGFFLIAWCLRWRQSTVSLSSTPNRTFPSRSSKASIARRSPTSVGRRTASSSSSPPPTAIARSCASRAASSVSASAEKVCSASPPSPASSSSHSCGREGAVRTRAQLANDRPHEGGSVVTSEAADGSSCAADTPGHDVVVAVDYTTDSTATHLHLPTAEQRQCTSDDAASNPPDASRRQPPDVNDASDRQLATTRFHHTIQYTKLRKSGRHHLISSDY